MSHICLMYLYYMHCLENDLCIVWFGMWAGLVGKWWTSHHSWWGLTHRSTLTFHLQVPLVEDALEEWREGTKGLLLRRPQVEMEMRKMRIRLLIISFCIAFTLCAITCLDYRFWLSYIFILGFLFGKTFCLTYYSFELKYQDFPLNYFLFINF